MFDHVSDVEARPAFDHLVSMVHEQVKIYVISIDTGYKCHMKTRYI